MPTNNEFESISSDSEPRDETPTDAELGVPPYDSYYCEVCDIEFVGPHAKQRYAAHHRTNVHTAAVSDSGASDASAPAPEVEPESGAEVESGAGAGSSVVPGLGGVGSLSRALTLHQTLISKGSQIGLPDGPTEESTEYDGVFSYAVEWHAFLFGGAMGLWLAHDLETATPVIVGLIMAAFGADVVSRATKRVPEYIRKQIQAELHYFVGGVLVGYVIILYLHGETPPLPEWLPFQSHH